MIINVILTYNDYQNKKGGYNSRRSTNKQGRKRPLDTPKRMIEKRERER